jgi:hypothetical protein
MTITEAAQLAREYERQQMQDAPSEDDYREAAAFKFQQDGPVRAPESNARTAAPGGSGANLDAVKDTAKESV